LPAAGLCYYLVGAEQFEFQNSAVVLINVVASDCDRSGKLKVMRVLPDLTAKQVVIH